MELLTVEFSREHLSIVRDFHCGTSPWAIAAADWIKSAPPFPSALRSITDYGTKVWLHFTEVPANAQRELVGFSPLGPTRMSVPYPDGSRRHIQYIPMMAVKLAFQGKYLEPGRKYSVAILEYVIEKACERRPEDLGLQVHVENGAAIALYNKFGFVTNGVPDDRGMLRMLKRLP